MARYDQVLTADALARRLAFAAAAARGAAFNVPTQLGRTALTKATALTEKAGRKQAAADAAHASFEEFRSKIKTAGWFGLAAVVVVIVTLPAWAVPPEWKFLWEFVSLLLALAALGLGINGRVLGAAIDARNRVSLSKLQMYVWLALAVAGLLTMTADWLMASDTTAPLQPSAAALQAFARTATPGSPPPRFMPDELLLALGISATSFVATPLLLTLKSNEEPTQDAIDKVASTRGTPPRNQGKVDARADPAEANLADIFHGDEVGTTLSVDVGKVQQIAIGLLVVAIYAAAIFKALHDGEGQIAGLPPMNDDFVKLLAISHASYLAYKAAPKSSSQTAGT